MDLSALAVLLQDLGDNAELTDRIKNLINQSEATDLLQHFRLDAVITGDCTTHIEYKVAQGLAPRKIEKRWYRRKESIGRGSYGQVWLEREDNKNQAGDNKKNQRAVKILGKDLMTHHGIDYKKELLALAKFSKPQYQQQEVLVKFLGWFEQPSDLMVYMEYFELGDLDSHITASITEDDIKDISTNLLNGLRIMHHEGFAHRDLKPGNIFVVQKPPAANWWVKIGDFGISKRVNHELTALYTSIGTPLYMAPEVTGDLDTDEPTSRYDNAVDMWSLGCVLYKVATQAVPFPARRSLRRFCNGGAFPEQPLLDRITPEGTEFVKGLLVPDPGGRLSAESALNNSWLSQRRRPSEDSIRSASPEKPEVPEKLETGSQLQSAKLEPLNASTETSSLPSDVRDIVDSLDAAEATVRLSTPGASPIELVQSEVDDARKAVTHTLAATKQLLEKLTEWSRQQASVNDVSEAYVSCGYEFNLACRTFKSVGIDTTDTPSFPDLLRTVLEEALVQDASPQALDRYLPRVRDIMINMLHWLKKKHALLPKETQKQTPVPIAKGYQKYFRRPQETQKQTPVPIAGDYQDYLQRPQETQKQTPVPIAGDYQDYLQRPQDDGKVDQLFLALMEKRGWKNLPVQARQQMLAYPAAKKWTLIHQDRLVDLQQEMKNLEEGSPECWVKLFLETRGFLALANALAKIHRKKSPQSSSDDPDVGNEFSIIKCFKALMNNKFGADHALSHPQILIPLINSLVSPGLNIRKLVSEILTFLTHWGDGLGHQNVLEAMDHVKDQHHEAGRFDLWMRVFEGAIDTTQPHMHNSSSKTDGEQNLFLEYCLSTTFFINMLVDAPEYDRTLRCHIRAQFISCGIKRILSKLEGFKYEVMDKQIERFRENESIDDEDLKRKEVVPWFHFNNQDR
ncbi:hypothetical protein FE257_006045 [Aspergillus nanangensis]|uniref:Protein kinase domain-containing protein n=1 Tax=Aspergillus nanangensis TaxID=2582783 RepID=A0AAD4CQ22_ASPNN|nr:hypothetical protein FE257_006045 [Aspergillus nanangensis]